MTTKLITRVGKSAHYTVGKTYEAYQKEEGSNWWFVKNDKGTQCACENSMRNMDYWIAAETRRSYKRVSAGHHDFTKGATYIFNFINSAWTSINDNNTPIERRKTELSNERHWQLLGEPITITLYRKESYGSVFTEGNTYVFTKNPTKALTWNAVGDNDQIVTRSSSNLDDETVWSTKPLPATNDLSGTYERVEEWDRLTVGKHYNVTQKTADKGTDRYTTLDDNGNRRHCTPNDLGNNKKWQKIVDLAGFYKRLHETEFSSLTVGKIYEVTTRIKNRGCNCQTIDDNGQPWTTTTTSLSNPDRWERVEAPTHQHPTQPEQDPMTNVKIKKTTLVNDQDVDNCSADELIDLIRQEGRDLEILSEVSWTAGGKSKYIDKAAKKHEKNIKKLVELLDSK